MKYKPNWPEAKERLTALWHGRSFGNRPCIAVTAPSGRKRVPSPPAPVDAPWRKWLDPDWVIPDMLARMENTWWGGEAMPSYLTMGGWCVSMGGVPNFDLNTIWFDPKAPDYSKPSPYVLKPDDEWAAKYEKLYIAAAKAAGKDDFLLGKPVMLPANDLLSMHMGTEEFLMAVMSERKWLRDAIVNGARSLMQERLRLRGIVSKFHDFWYGNGGWMPFWAPQPFLCCQSDVSCMMSPDMYEEFIVPELELTSSEDGALWYHLDGSDAKQHLPRLLSFPFMKVIQFTPKPSDPPNGPAHLEMYRQIQAAGKIVHIDLSQRNIRALVENLDPGLIMYNTGSDSIQEAEELLEASARWMNSGKV